MPNLNYHLKLNSYRLDGLWTNVRKWLIEHQVNYAVINDIIYFETIENKVEFFLVWEESLIND